MGGWFRKEIKTDADLKGLKFRIAGLAGEELSRLGVVPQQIAGGDIYPALERGAIDAAEWIGPYDDQKLGFNKVAPYYYYPGWWEGTTVIHAMINKDSWQKLPDNYKAALEAAMAEANTWMSTRYDASNPAALRELIGQGTQIKAFPQEVVAACAQAATEVLREKAAANPRFARIYEKVVEFRRDAYLAYQLTDGAYDSTVISGLRGKHL
jgi:TRAP-type mannitol/chloroaromatic compound transport system substrate-binding protein